MAGGGCEMKVGIGFGSLCGLVLAGTLACCPVAAVAAGWDRSLDEFPACADETDDTARLQRAIDATPDGVLYVPRGVYRISRTLKVENRCSLDFHKGAVLRAVADMEFVVAVNCLNADADDYNVFISGGTIDGAGRASCMFLTGFVHLTVKDMTFLNGRKDGLRVAGGYELIANNLYFICKQSGLAGNVALHVLGGDSHYTDCISVDYTTGFKIAGGGSNRLTRCHAWGGPLPPVKPGEPREMLKDSVCFRIGPDACSTILRDCYADTGKIGFEIDGWETRLLGCSYLNNYGFKLDDVTVIKHTRGRLLVSEGAFVKSAPKFTLYEGCGEVEWSNMMYSEFADAKGLPGALTFKKKSADEQPVRKPAGK